jgi:hypothetical protein
MNEPIKEEVTSICYHKSLNVSFFGTVSGDRGDICCVPEVFNEFKIVKRLEIEGGVFCMAPSGDNQIFLGGRCRLLRVTITRSPAGFYEFTLTQQVDTNVIPRSLATIGDFVVHFGMVRSITFLSRSQDGTLEKVHEHFLPLKIHTGIAGRQLSSRSAHLFIVDTEVTLTVFSLKWSSDSIKVTALTTIRLESSISSLSMVRDGFALLATRDGALLVLMEYDRLQTGRLTDIARGIGQLLPFEPAHSAIVETTVLDLFRKLTPEVQNSLGITTRLPPDEIDMIITKMSRCLGRLCSTL